MQCCTTILLLIITIMSLVLSLAHLLLLLYILLVQAFMDLITAIGLVQLDLVDLTTEWDITSVHIIIMVASEDMPVCIITEACLERLIRENKTKQAYFKNVVKQKNGKGLMLV